MNILIASVGIHYDGSRTPTGDTGASFLVLDFRISKGLGFRATFRFSPVSWLSFYWFYSGLKILGFIRPIFSFTRISGS